MTPLLRCENIHKDYYLGRTTLPVLRGVDLTMAANQFISIMGSSGSGKSTLLHILGGLDVPQQGQVYFRGQPLFEPEQIRRIPLGRDADATALLRPNNGKAVAGLARARLANDALIMESRRNDLRNAAFGFVFQFYHLLPEFDVLENVLLPRIVGRSVGGWLTHRAEGMGRALELLHRVGLGDRLNHRPNELSGGERQRVAIARALMNQPEVLLADEPTGNLDRQSGRDILNLLKELNSAGQAVIMVTHDRELAAEADQVVNLVDGRVK